MKIMVLKFGSKILANKNGRISRILLEDIARQIDYAISQGWYIAIVSSGAILTGFPRLMERKIGNEVDKKSFNQDVDTPIITEQIASMIGQTYMVGAWGDVLRPYNIEIAQGLLTDNDIDTRAKKRERRNIIFEMWRNYIRIVPIFNENDFTSTHELRMLGKQGDNDGLTKEVALMLKNNDKNITVKVVFVTDVDGLLDEKEKVIKRVDNIRKAMSHVIRHANVIPGLSKGGMESKLRAIAELGHGGIGAYIVNGHFQDAIIMVSDGKNPGTYVLPSRRI